MSDDATLVELLALRTKIASCGEHFIIRNTLRYRAMCLAAALVDPTWAAEQAGKEHPPLRSGAEMAADIDPVYGF